MDATRKTLADYYDKNAQWWATKKTNSFFHEEGFRTFHAQLQDGAAVLDIGCAYGIHVPLFLGIGRNLTYRGFDLSEQMIAIAQSHYPQLQFSVADLLAPETLPQQKFQGLFAAAILMHIPEQEWGTMLIMLETLSAPGAVMYFTMPQERPNEASEEDQRHFSIIPQEKLQALLTDRGWEFIETGEFPDDPRGIWHWYLVRLPS